MITAMPKGKKAAYQTGGTGQQPEPHRRHPNGAGAPWESNGQQYSGNRAGGSYGVKPRQRLCGGPEPETFRSQSSSFSLYALLKLLVPVLCIVLLILVVKLAKPESGTKETEGPTAVETMESTEAAEQETESTGPVYRTTDVLNVRPAEYFF